MADKKETKRLSKGMRKHLRRTKQAARKEATPQSGPALVKRAPKKEA